MKQLSDKQLRFVELYNGNATDAATLAGYKYPKDAGSRALKNVEICRLIQERRAQEIKPDIMNRQELQKFWSDMAKDTEMKPLERLKASEHLAKSEGLFLEKTEHSGNMSLNLPPSITVIFTDEK